MALRRTVLGVLASRLVGGSLALALQYPLTSSFPIGGDAARTIYRANEVVAGFSRSLAEGFAALKTNSNYPLSTLLVASGNMLPSSWPIRWMWFLAIAQVTTGAALAYVTWRLAGPIPAVFAFAAWSIAGLAFTRHIEDGTLAQLMSLPPLLIALERLWSGRFLTAGLLIAITFSLHPLSGLWLLACVGLVLATTVIATPLPARQVLRYGIVLAAIITVGAFILSQYRNVIPIYPASDEGISLHDVVRNPIGPLVLMVPFGLLTLWRTNPRAARWVTQALFISILLVWHSRVLGGSVFLERFRTYFALLVALLGSVGLYAATKAAFQRSLAATLFASLLLGMLGLETWQQNSHIFTFYDSSSGYERIHARELEAFAWMEENLPRGSFIVSTVANRHTDWIPVLTHHKWEGLNNKDQLFTEGKDTLRAYLASKPYTHLIFLKKREDAADVFGESLSLFPKVYENKATLIYQLSP